jgi:transposase
MDQARHDAGSYQRVEVITGSVRRRQWSAAEKARIVAESADPGANVSEVARRNGVSRGVLNIWRRQARRAPFEERPFVQLQVEGSGEEKERTFTRKLSPARAVARIEIAVGGATVRVPDGVDGRTLDLVLAALRSAR